MTEIVVNRSNALIDPTLHIWGWEIPVYLFLGGLAAGIMILSALLARRDGARRNGAGPIGAQETASRWSRWMPFAAPIAISIGMGALLLDLEYKRHVLRFYAAFQLTSPMSWGAWILVGIYPATILLGLLGLTDGETDALARFRPVAALRLGGPLRALRAWAARHAEAVRWANVALGVGLGAYTGVLLGTLGARALWGSALLGPLFLVSGLSTGAALLMLFPLNHDEHGFLRRWDMVAIGVELALLGLFLVGLFTTGGQGGREAAESLFGGPYTASFWAIVVVLGLVVPFGLEAAESRKGLAPSRIIPLLLLLGGFALRWILVAAGQA